jgi:NAD(P)-dependent dehydrogenase (short-subunit alcohol dehydrogenase family)
MLANRLALVTGAGSGIGNAIASIFSKHGANVAMVDLSQNLNDLAKGIEDKCKTKTSAHICDVSNSMQVNNLFKEIKEKYAGQVPSIIGKLSNCNH